MTAAKRSNQTGYSVTIIQYSKLLTSWLWVFLNRVSSYKLSQSAYWKNPQGLLSTIRACKLVSKSERFLIPSNKTYFVLSRWRLQNSSWFHVHKPQGERALQWRGIRNLYTNLKSWTGKNFVINQCQSKTINWLWSIYDDGCTVLKITCKRTNENVVSFAQSFSSQSKIPWPNIEKSLCNRW